MKSGFDGEGRGSTSIGLSRSAERLESALSVVAARVGEGPFAHPLQTSISSDGGSGAQQQSVQFSG
jgi:hypothetical protein